MYDCLLNAGDQVMEEFNHIVGKPWIERLKRVDPDTQKAFDLDRQVGAHRLTYCHIPYQQ